MATAAKQLPLSNDAKLGRNTNTTACTNGTNGTAAEATTRVADNGREDSPVTTSLLLSITTTVCGERFNGGRQLVPTLLRDPSMKPRASRIMLWSALSVSTVRCSCEVTTESYRYMNTATTGSSFDTIIVPNDWKRLRSFLNSQLEGSIE